METKSILNREFTEQGGFQVPEVVDKIFKDHPDMKEEVQEKLEKYHLNEAAVEPQNPATTRKYMTPASADGYRDRVEDPYGRI